jgi:hypothetical protein
MSAPILIEAGLFEAAGLTDDLAIAADGGHALRLARRLLALAWLLAGGLSDAPGDLACRASVAFWAEHAAALRSWRPASLAAILFQLEALGVIDSFTATDDGFHVQLKEGQK